MIELIKQDTSGGCRQDIISRHITIQPENDDYRRLSNYIANASHQGEKVLMSRCAGCWSDDDEYQLAIHEVEAVQAMNIFNIKKHWYGRPMC